MFLADDVVCSIDANDNEWIALNLTSFFFSLCNIVCESRKMSKN